MMRSITQQQKGYSKWKSVGQRASPFPTRQAKSTSGEKAEREADNVADQALRQSEPRSTGICACGGGCPRCQAKRAAEGKNVLQASPVQGNLDAQAVPASVHKTLRSPGRPLDSRSQAFFESHFGEDLSDVRIHTDRRAADSAKAERARAYTVGQDIVFGADQYAPHTQHGKWLLAHELTHVLQQRAGHVAMQKAEVDDNPTFCFTPEGFALQEVSSIINGWIADAQAHGRPDVPTAIHHELGVGWDKTGAERKIAKLSPFQVRHVPYEESRYLIDPNVLKHWFKGESPIAPVINLCGVCVGSDKVGHFFQQGEEYFRIGEALRQRIQDWTPDEREAFLITLNASPTDFPPQEPDEDFIIEAYTHEFGKWLEGFESNLPLKEIYWLKTNLIPKRYFGGIYGGAASGVLSRADLEANRQGGRFYREAMRRPNVRLNICNYVNNDWNEYSNPNSFGGVGLYVPKSGPQDTIVHEIPFNTNSDYPDDAAMEILVGKLTRYQDNLRRGEFHISFSGHTSRLGNDAYNQTLSLRRAEAVKGRLQWLLGMVLNNLNFAFDSLVEPKGCGETRAMERGRSETDDSQLDRVVKVTFSVGRTPSEPDCT